MKTAPEKEKKMTKNIPDSQSETTYVKSARISWKCTECPKQFKWSDRPKEQQFLEPKITKHMREVHLKHLVLCSQNGSNKSNIKTKDTKKCNECPKTFPGSANQEKIINLHISRSHKKSKPSINTKEKPTKIQARITKCKLCYREYKGNAAKKNLTIHQTNVHQEDIHLLPSLSGNPSQEEFQHQCPLCDLKFVSATVLIYHVKISHKEGKNESKANAKEKDESDSRDILRKTPQKSSEKSIV